MIDTHTHLQFESFNQDRDAVIKRMEESGVKQAVVVGTDVLTSAAAVKLTNNYEQLFAVVGVHPGDTAGLNIAEASRTIEQMISAKTKAIGEIGFDYKMFDGIEVNKEVQAEMFECMIDLANKYNLPAILHSRMAERDVINFVKNGRLKRGAVVHCFTADYETAELALDAGLLISFTAMLTYPKNEELRRVVAKLPHDRVMLETDCPFLPPQEIRGRRNEPVHLMQVAEAVAQAWGRDVAYVDEITTKTAQQFFNLP